MADVKDISPDLERLDAQLDALEEALQPLTGNLEGMTSQLPLLDKAKLFALSAYSLESLLFSALKLQGTDAQEHAVFDELKRVQQYFAKIKTVEEPGEQRTLTLNQEAAARVLKADLADNKIVSSKLAEKIAEERAKALLKTVENRKRPAEDSPVPRASPAPGAQEAKNKKKHRGKGRQRK